MAHSSLTHQGPLSSCPCDQSEPHESAINPEVKNEAKTNALLFATATCPNCKIACALLDKEGFAYTKLLANENVELVNKYGVKQAPTLVIIHGDGFEKYAGVSDIKKYLGK